LGRFAGQNGQNHCRHHSSGQTLGCRRGLCRCSGRRKGVRRRNDTHSIHNLKSYARVMVLHTTAPRHTPLLTLRQPVTVPGAGPFEGSEWCSPRAGAAIRPTHHCTASGSTNTLASTHTTRVWVFRVVVQPMSETNDDVRQNPLLSCGDAGSVGTRSEHMSHCTGSR